MLEGSKINEKMSFEKLILFKPALQKQISHYVVISKISANFCFIMSCFL